MIHIPCQNCNGAGRYTIGRPNDPVAPLYVCDECDGDGQARCEARGCREIAVDAVVIGNSAVPLCTAHMTAWQETEDADATD